MSTRALRRIPRRSGLLLGIVLAFVSCLACGGADKKPAPAPLNTAIIPESKLQQVIDAAAVPAISSGFYERQMPYQPSGCPQPSQQAGTCLPSAPRTLVVYGNDKGVVLTVQLVAGIDSNEAKSETKTTRTVTSYATRTSQPAV